MLLKPTCILGKGSYGIVTKVVDESGKEYALKRIPILDPDGFQFSPFLEISCLSQLDHPNIIKPIRYYHDTTYFYILMPYYEHNVIKTKEPVKVMFQLLSACHHMEKNKIIHADLKPSNIMLDQDGNVKIIDFGISVWHPFHSMKYNYNIVSLWWRAPEILDKKPYSNKVDIWALGVIFYELLVGQKLFSGDKVNDYLQSIKENLPKLQNLTSPFRELIIGMLEPDPEKRWSISTCLAFSLFEEYDKRNEEGKMRDFVRNYVGRREVLEWGEELSSKDVPLWIDTVQIFDRLMGCFVVKKDETMKELFLVSRILAKSLHHKHSNMDNLMKLAKLDIEGTVTLVCECFKKLGYNAISLHSFEGEPENYLAQIMPYSTV